MAEALPLLPFPFLIPSLLNVDCIAVVGLTFSAVFRTPIHGGLLTEAVTHLKSSTPWATYLVSVCVMRMDVGHVHNPGFSCRVYVVSFPYWWFSDGQLRHVRAGHGLCFKLWMLSHWVQCKHNTRQKGKNTLQDELGIVQPTALRLRAWCYR